MVLKLKKQILNYSFYFVQYIVLYSTLKPENLTLRSKFLKLNYRLRFFSELKFLILRKKKSYFKEKFLNKETELF